MARKTEIIEYTTTEQESIPIILYDSGSKICFRPKKKKATVEKSEIAIILGLRSGSMAEGTVKTGSATNRKAKKKVAAPLVFTIRHMFWFTYRITVQFTKSFEKLE